MPDDAATIREHQILIRRLEEDMRDVQKHKASRRDLDGLSDSFDSLVAEVRYLRNALIFFALTVAASAMAVVFAVVQGGATS